MTIPIFLLQGMMKCREFPGVHAPSSDSSFAAGWASYFTARETTKFLYQLRILPFLVLFLSAAILALQPLVAAMSSSDTYEQPIPRLVASLENETNSFKYTVVQVTDVDAILSDGVDLQGKYHGQIQGEPVLVNHWLGYQIRQALLPRPPPDK
jgi:hypothetical protein